MLLVLVSGWIVTGTWIDGGLGMGFQHSVGTGIEKDWSRSLATILWYGSVMTLFRIEEPLN